ncbi:hypothetical protein J3B02_001292 [Coemansia erecta]|uniref:Signal peptidase complex subunit 1 n=1 Tax=Coemansia asiatica TaxID=1052880 RepID=A0A9W7XK66_9FUNG|nr:hypothetical protein LPJ64_003918 [Coemansia asiatica]KAJ2856982.1 hypothetical protein J3B02_001292 [Coemansia erecta]KAJ2873785.1 hypothetical protein FB639_004174 [Coemansia asiatica]
MELLKPLFESGRIDFQGQDLAGSLATALLALSATVSLGVGFLQKTLSMTFYVYAIGVLLTYLVVLPAWPFFKRNQVNWLPRRTIGAPALVDSPNQPLSRKTLVEDVSDDNDE